MATIIEAVYENGVLRPLAPDNLKERQHYRVILEEIAGSEVPRDSAHPDAAHEERVITLPDGRRIVRLAAALAGHTSTLAPDGDPIADALANLRRERAAHFEAVLDRDFPAEPEK